MSEFELAILIHRYKFFLQTVIGVDNVHMFQSVFYAPEVRFRAISPICGLHFKNVLKFKFYVGYEQTVLMIIKISTNF